MIKPLSRDEFFALLVINHFRVPADEDYYFARLVWHEKFTRQFHWSANQAIEKYLKCIFMLNGRSPDFGHKWLAAYTKALTDNFQPLLIIPKYLTSPVGSLLPTTVSLTSFLERMSKAGVPDVRYNEIRHNDVDFHDLTNLDSFCAWLRMVCIPGEVFLPGDIADPHAFAIANLPEKIATAFKKDNAAFFPDEATAPVPYARLSNSTLEMTMMHARHQLRGDEVLGLIEEYAVRVSGGKRDKAYERIISYLSSLGMPSSSF